MKYQGNIFGGGANDTQTAITKIDVTPGCILLSPFFLLS